MTNKERRVDIIQDLDGNRVVVIHDVRFRGKRHINWDEVEEYLKQFVGESYVIDDTEDLIYIGADLPDEYTSSEYTISLKGTEAKAKANAAQGLPELIRVASKKNHKRNTKAKHKWDARYGWYRYEVRFALPVYDAEGMIERYNVFHAFLVVRQGHDRKLYLYDLLRIKKETGNTVMP